MDILRSVFSRDPCQKHYKLTRVLGQGSFAMVKLAERKSDGTKWAIKIIKKTSLSKEDEEGLRTEVKILEAMDHPNIVKLNQVFDCESHLYMVMELCTGGELFDRIVMKERYTENEARDCIIQVATAILYCHDNGIVHRDIKPENLLYSDFDDTTAVLKLADFGLAKLLTEHAILNTACGTPGYVAPEILECRPYGKEVDMWSVGVIAYILLCGFPPFYDENNSTMFKAIKSGNFDYPSPFWDNIDPSAKDMINCLLVLDTEKRYSAGQLLQHPWLTQGRTKAGDHNLALFKQSMKAYNARRKFRATIMTVQMMSTLDRSLGGKIIGSKATPVVDTGKEGVVAAPPTCGEPSSTEKAGAEVQPTAEGGAMIETKPMALAEPKAIPAPESGRAGEHSV
ncbi:unnamed protein product [Ascophyllum nodosum]